MSCCWKFTDCSEPVQCPPWLAQVPVQPALEGVAFTISSDELFCDYGSQLRSLVTEICGQEDECNLATTILNKAAAFVWAKIAICYDVPLQLDAKPLFSEAFDPNSLPIASAKYRAYWLIREWIGVVAQYMLHRDYRPVADGDGKPMFVRRYEEVVKILDGCADCGCEFLPGLDRAFAKSKSGFGVAARESIEFENSCARMTSYNCGNSCNPCQT